MSFVKYRVKEVAADFGMAPKEISDIISKYYEKPKSYTQVLTDNELNAVFDHITQHNQIASLEQVFAVKPAPKAEPVKEAPKAPAAERPQQNVQARPQQQGNRPQQPAQNRPQQQGNRPQQGNFQNRPQQSAQNQPAPKPAEPERKRERRVVDTSAVQVNANRFADVDNLVSERVQNYEGANAQQEGQQGPQ